MVRHFMILCSILWGILTVNHYSRGLFWEPVFLIWVFITLIAFIIYRLETSKF